MGLSAEFLRRLREEGGEEEPEETPSRTGPKPPPVMLMIRVYGPDTLFLTNVPRPKADEMVRKELAYWVNEDAIKLTIDSLKLAQGPGLTPGQKARRRAQEKRR